MQGEEFEVCANDENPNFQRVPDQLSDENPPVGSQSPQSSQPRLPHPRRRITSQQFERNVRARQSTSSFDPVPSSEAALTFSVDSLEPACLSNSELPCDCRHFLRILKTTGLLLRHPGVVLVKRRISRNFMLMSVHSFEQLKTKKWISGSAVMWSPSARGQAFPNSES